MNDAAMQNFEEQIAASRMLIENDTLDVIIVGVAVDKQGRAWIGRSVSDDMTVTQGEAIVEGLMVEVERITALIEKAKSRR